MCSADQPQLLDIDPEEASCSGGIGEISGNRQGGASEIHQANAGSNLTVWEQSLTNKRCCLPIGYMRRELNTGTLVATLLALAMKPLNSVSL